MHSYYCINLLVVYQIAYILVTLRVKLHGVNILCKVQWKYDSVLVMLWNVLIQTWDQKVKFEYFTIARLIQILWNTSLVLNLILWKNAVSKYTLRYILQSNKLSIDMGLGRVQTLGLWAETIFQLTRTRSGWKWDPISTLSSWSPYIWTRWCERCTRHFKFSFTFHHRMS